MSTKKNTRGILTGVLALGLMIGVSMFANDRLNSPATAQKCVEDAGILSVFADSDGAEHYRVRAPGGAERSAIAALSPYYVIVLRKTDDYAAADDGGGPYNCIWDNAWADGIALSDKDAFETGTVAFVVKSVSERQAYRDEDDNVLWGDREKADVYVYDIATETFFDGTTLYGAEFADTYVTNVGAGDFTNEVSETSINNYIESLFAKTP